MAAPTDSELLDAFKLALLACSSNQSYAINGRTYTRSNLPEIRSTIVWLEGRIAAADTSIDETGTNTLLARFN